MSLAHDAAIFLLPDVHEELEVAMKWRAGLIAMLLAVFLVPPTAQAQAQNCPPLTQSQRTALRNEHLYGGQPSPGPVLVRRAYITQYDTVHRMPRWTAWQAAPDYLHPPNRSGQWATFRTDPNVANPVRTTDYNGVGALDMARGHMVPYSISGGDRDHDGLRAPNDLYDNAEAGCLDQLRATPSAIHGSHHPLLLRENPRPGSLPSLCSMLPVPFDDLAIPVKLPLIQIQALPAVSRLLIYNPLGEVLRALTWLPRY